MTTKPREDMNRIIDLPDDLYRKLHYNLEFSASATREDVRKRWWAFSKAPPRGVGPKTLAAVRAWIDGGPPDGAPRSHP